MIADLVFPPARGRVRPARFVRRSSVPLSAACVVASSLRETLRELVGACEVVLGEPAAIDESAWRALARGNHCFLTRGRLTDIVLVIPLLDARRLVLRAFGEANEYDSAPISALESHALERIAARCAHAFDALCAERRGPAVAIPASDVPACAAYFDVRVSAPLPITLGIGIVRDVPGVGPGPGIDSHKLLEILVAARAEFASGMVSARSLATLQVGDVVRLDTKVGAPAALKLGETTIATGDCGFANAHAAFLVRASPRIGASP